MLYIIQSQAPCNDLRESAPSLVRSEVVLVPANQNANSPQAGVGGKHAIRRDDLINVTKHDFKMPLALLFDTPLNTALELSPSTRYCRGDVHAGQQPREAELVRGELAVIPRGSSY